MNKLKKAIMAALIGGTMMATAICSAAVSNSHLTLGGIAFMSSPSYAQQVYGGELFTNSDGAAFLDYGTFKIYYTTSTAQEKIKATRPGYYMATSIASIANNGIATPAGIKVGMKADELTSIYGEPDVTLSKNDSTLLQQLGVSYDKLYIYYAPNGGKICFMLQKNLLDHSKIVGILITDTEIH